jgi:alpha-tubulin suppressor-like RCC1 family protein
MLDIVLSFPAPATATTVEKFLYVWGSNNSGELGDPSSIDVAQSWTSISSGHSHAAAIRSDGTLWTWGNHANVGLLGLNIALNYYSPVQVGTDSWTSVAAGGSHTVAIRSDSALFAWGLNSSGQLGLDDTINRSSPVQVGTSSWTMVNANNLSTAAIDVAGRLFTWGGNAVNNLGLGDTTNRSSPVAIAGSWTTVSMGHSHTVGIKSDGKLMGWGLNAENQLSYPLGQVRSWSVLESAYGSTFGITDIGYGNIGYLYAWGLNDQGQLGLGDTTNRSSPVQVGSSSDFYSTLSIGNKHVFAYSAVGAQLYVWGLNSSGQLGLGDTTNRSVPTALGGANEWLSNGVVAGNGFSLLISGTGQSNLGGTDGISNRLYATGSGTNKASGLNGDNVSSPVMIQEGGIIDIGMNGLNTKTQVLKENGEIWTTAASPTLFASGFKQLSAGRSHHLGLKNDGTLWAWSLTADNTGGQLGDGTSVGTGKSSPIQIGTGNSWVLVSAGNNTSAAIRADGALFVWGRNDTQGQLGLGNMTSRSSPVQLGTRSWSAVHMSDNSAAIDSAGALWTWGKNDVGQLGLGNTTSLSSPVQVGSNKWLSVITMNQTTAAIRADNTLWTWGANTFGILGVGDTTNRSSPVQVGTGSWIQVSIGGGSNFTPVSALGIDINGYAFGWGRNDVGQLGLADTTDRSSPVQIGTRKYKLARQVNAQGGTYAALIDEFNRPWCLGNGSNAAFGRSGSAVDTSPARNFVTQVSGWTTVSTAGSHTVGIYQGNLYTWGTSELAREQPCVGGTIDYWKHVDASDLQFLGVKNDGSVWYSRYRSPVLIKFDTGPLNFKKVMQHNAAYIGLTEDGQLYGWGTNNFGQLGLNDASTPTTPTRIGADKWRDFSIGGTEHNDVSFHVSGTGYGAVLAIRADGALFGWGNNVVGQLGLGDTTNRSSPTQIGTDSWISVGTMGISAAVRSDGGLFTWGKPKVTASTGNQLGDGTTTARSSPVQVGTDSWTAVYIGAAHSAAIRTDGSLYMWGLNRLGGLGDGTTTNTSSPVLVAGGHTWKHVSLGQSNWRYSNTSFGTRTVGTKTDGTIWIWGARGEQSWFPSGASTTPVQITSFAAIGTQPTMKFASISRTNSGYDAEAMGLYLSESGVLWFNSQQRATGRETEWDTGGNNVISNPVIFGAFPAQSRPDGNYVPTPTRAYIGKNDNSASFVWNWPDGPRLDSVPTFTRAYASLWQCFAIDNAGSLWGWGSSYGSELFKPAYEYYRYFIPQQIDTTKSWSMIGGFTSSNTAGYGRAVGVNGITTDGKLWRWGWLRANNFTGDGTSAPLHPSSSPVQIGSSQSWLAVGTRFNFSNYASRWAISTDKIGHYWGYNNYGQLGTNNSTSTSGIGTITALSLSRATTPEQLGTASWTTVSAGVNHTLGIKTNGTLWGWGDNTNGKLGLGDTTARSLITQIGTDTDWQKVSAGRNANYLIKTNGTAYHVGQGTYGQSGIGNESSNSTPTQIPGSWTMMKVNPLRTNVKNVFGIKSDGLLYGWGWLESYGLSGNTSDLGQLQGGAVYTLPNLVGNSLSVIKTPIKLGSDTWIAASAGASHTLAIRSDGTLFTWGNNSSGQLGQGNTTYLSSPVQVGTSSWTAVSAGDAHSMAIRSDGGLFTWGNNGSGRLGDGTATSRSSPVQIGTSSWTAISAGGTHSLALRSDGSLFAWGINTSGQLGQGNTTVRSSPVQIGTDSWTAIAAGGSHNVAIRSDGALFAWGNNGTGRLGDGTTTSRSSPVQVGADSWTLVTAGNQHTAGITKNSILYAWGRNNYGQLGLNDLVDTSSPAQVGTGSWTAVEAGTWHTVGVRSTGALYAWGYNYDGQLGDGTVDTRSSPVQIGSDIDHLTASAGGAHTITLKTV